MRFTLEMACDNAAFIDAGASVEAARILRDLADKLERDGDQRDRVLLDINGNRIGVARFED